MKTEISKVTYGVVKPGKRRCKHGHYRSPTYYSWLAMWDRCRRSLHEAYHRYGGRGITVCERWRSFELFLEDMGERPDGMTLDRINNDGNYEKTNCRWATIKTQMRNRCNNHRLLFNGQNKTIEEWCDLSGIPSTTLRERIRRGWKIEDALTRPVAHKGRAASTPFLSATEGRAPCLTPEPAPLLSSL